MHLRGPVTNSTSEVAEDATLCLAEERECYH